MVTGPGNTVTISEKKDGITEDDEPTRIMEEQPITGFSGLSITMKGDHADPAKSNKEHPEHAKKSDHLSHVKYKGKNGRVY